MHRGLALAFGREYPRYTDDAPPLENAPCLATSHPRAASEPILLSRDDFACAVFARANQRCVLCGQPAVDAHHVLDRKLYPDGGYYLDNGAAVCSPCHLDCEHTRVSVETVRHAAGITSPVLPASLEPCVSYDKWGEPIAHARLAPGRPPGR